MTDWPTMTLNPASSEGPLNPLCPNCEEEIVPEETEEQRKFVCGCDTVWQFQFGGEGDIINPEDEGDDDDTVRVERVGQVDVEVKE